MTSSCSSDLIADIRQASQYLKRGQRTKALSIYREVREQADGQPQVQFEIGNLCCEFGDLGLAVEHYKAAASESPENLIYLSTLGVVALNAGEFDDAHDFLSQALALDANCSTACIGLGTLFLHMRDYAKAAVHLERGCELKPSDVSAQVNLAVALSRLGRHDDALVHANKAVRLDHGNPGARFVLAEVLAESGDIEAALKCLERIIRKHRFFANAYELLARLRKFTQADIGFVRRTAKLLETGMPPEDRVALLFALGKMHDDCGEYDTAYAHYEQGNRLSGKDYDVRNDERLLKSIKASFTAKNLNALASIGHQSAKPVFIVGMPRSGTTLMERIIASHPLAAGAGELSTMAELAGKILSPDSRGLKFTRPKLNITADQARAYAQEYLDVLSRCDSDAQRVVDKMPANFSYIGLIHALFPNATIIHAVRHPLDTCLSCYFQSFTHIRWASDLATIGRIYALYRQTMDHWQRVLPQGRIIEVQYEELVRDPQTHARRLLEACRLEWDPGVLEFFRDKTSIRTASLAQARQPIYTSSLKRWTGYARHLGPLVTQIAPYLEADRAVLAEQGIGLPRARSGLMRLIS